MTEITQAGEMSQIMSEHLSWVLEDCSKLIDKISKDMAHTASCSYNCTLQMLQQQECSIYWMKDGGIDDETRARVEAGTKVTTSHDTQTLAETLIRVTYTGFVARAMTSGGDDVFMNSLTGQEQATLVQKFVEILSKRGSDFWGPIGWEEGEDVFNNCTEEDVVGDDGKVIKAGERRQGKVTRKAADKGDEEGTEDADDAFNRILKSFGGKNGLH